jgi:hypothetical protein
MATIQIAVINASTVLTDDQVNSVVSVLQKQINRDFVPVWGVSANLAFVPVSDKFPPGAWWLVILDNPDQAGDFGYHDLTKENLPMGKVFAALDMQYKHHWTASASHELLEMLVDPDLNLSASVSTGETTQRLYAYEICDACESEEFGYKIDGTLVSDFVYPAWFESFHEPVGTQFDYSRKIKKPFELLPGGYINVFDGVSAAGWQQIHPKGETHHYHMRPSVGSRRERRRTRRDLWLPSKPTHHSTSRATTGP